ncbi:MAG: hypothetical protein RBT24_01250 [Arcobacteraceae bacterium]|jgi:hypothetical protein|nr:hypothetical protein [Arcobacteraceae bacterium]
MSMSQEEIEALMNGLEVPEEDSTSSEETEEESIEEDTPSQSMSEDDIAKLLSSTDEEEEIIEDSESKNADVKDDISEVLNEIDNMEDDDISSDDAEFTEKAKNWTEKKITKGEFPFPAEPSTKVVSQLNEVANDSEEKAGQIFDVLSFILDDNAVIQKSNKNMVSFLDKEIELLNALSNKFPNINIFDERLKEAQSMKEITSDIANRISAEDMRLFEAMELMQFHDINRQKIERVMSVIRKLTVYLNNLFEEDDDYEEIAVAKHIHGDSNSDLVGAEDLDALIAEFSK